MKEQVRRYFFLSFLLLVGIAKSNAQKDAGVAYASNNPSGSGIAVRWLGPQIYYDEGITIYRSKGDKDNWELISPAPIYPAKDLQNKIDRTEKQINLYDSYLSMNADSFRNSFVAIFTVIESIKDFDFALAINLAYVDATARNGSKYRYRIESSVDGKKVILGTTDKIECADFASLDPPKDFIAERRRKSTRINWENKENTYYAYDVYMKEKQGDWKLVGERLLSGVISEINKPYIVEMQTDKDSVYYYKVKGYDYFGNESKESDVFESLVLDFVPPQMPDMDVFTFSKQMSNRISWLPSVDTDISHYNVYRSLELGDESFNKVNKNPISAADTVYMDQLYEAGVYYYKVEAVDKSENRTVTFPFATEVFDILGPAAPANLVADSDSGILRFSWDASLDPSLKGYSLQRTLADDDMSDNAYVQITSSLLDTNYYELSMGANVRSEFVFVVKAVDSAMNYSSPSESVDARLPDVIPPAAPFIKQAFEKEGALAVEWMPNVEKDLAGYVLYRNVKKDTVMEQVNVLMIPRTISMYLDKSADRGVKYEYHLKAIDESDLSSESSNSVLGILNPLDLAGEITIVKERYSKVKGEVLLEWNFDKLKNEKVIGTAIFRSENGGTPLPVTEVTLDTKFKQKLTTIGKYQYHIRAYGARGGIIKSQSIEIQHILN